MKLLGTVVSSLLAFSLFGCASTADFMQSSSESDNAAAPPPPIYSGDQSTGQDRKIEQYQARIRELEQSAQSSLVLDREKTQSPARASIQGEWADYQRRPKRVFVGGNVREYAFARYVDNWLAKVERVGNLNYPEEARRQGVYGSLQLSVSLYADGSIETVAIDRSSGSKTLDEAAVKIVELAAPYEHFTDEMREKADILSITRTWTFTRSDRLSDGKWHE
jgi:TonB family protein